MQTLGSLFDPLDQEVERRLEGGNKRLELEVKRAKVECAEPVMKSNDVFVETKTRRQNVNAQGKSRQDAITAF